MTHLSPEQLADVDAVAQHEHLRGCARCRQEWEQQRAVRDLLRGLPGPGPIPPDVATGLRVALERLTPDDVEPAEPVSRPGAGGPTVVPLAAPTRRRTLPERARPWLAAAAAVVVLGGGGATLWHSWGGSGTGASSADSRSSAGNSFAESDTAAGGALTDRQVHDLVRASGTDYTKRDLAAQVRTRLLNGAAAGSAGVPSGATGDRLTSPSGLTSCLSALGVAAGAVTAVDLARFEGRPAAVVVLRAEGGGEDVWVVGRDCRQGDDQTRYFVRLS